MYSDYDIVYKSDINQFVYFWIAGAVIGVLLLVFTLISLSKVFKKANMSGLSAWIPIYNIYILVEIANLPKIYVLLLFVPIVNIYFYLKLCMTIGKLFKKKESFSLGLFFLPFIYYPILAFSDSEYIGLNLVAKEGITTVKDIPIIDENKNKEIEVEVNEEEDVANRNINISIGGGVYQKEYTNSLDSVDKEKMLNISKQPEVKKEVINTKTPTFINDNTISEIAKVDATMNGVVEPEKPIKMEGELFTAPYVGEVPVAPVAEEKKEESVNTINGVEISARSEAITPAKPVPSENGEYSVCPNCGTRVGENNKMCFICGQTLE